MSRNTTRAEATVTLNGQQAEQVLEKLRQQATDLRKRLEAARSAGDTDQVRRLERELNAVNGSLRNVQRATYDYSQVLRNINGANLRDLEKTARALRSEIRRLAPDTQEFIERSRQLEQVRNRIRQLTQSTREQTSAWGRMADGFNKYFGIVTAFVGTITGLSYTFRKLAEEVAKMDDIYADVMKYTGLTKEEISGLNEEFKKMDTRTSREELNRLAGEAGKIGEKGVKNLKAFAEAANILQVSLGEDLGKDAVKSIGKLAKIFGDSDRMGLKEAMLAVGSAINEVAQNSTAAEPYLVDFTNRMAGVGNQAKMTIPQIIGFASVLDQNAMAVELSSTALDKLIITLFNKTGDVARAAGIPLQELNEALKRDTNEALLMVFEALNKKGGIADLAPLFKDLGAEGARSAKIISTLAGKFPDIVKEQATATKAFEEGTSVINEYGVKNETLQAQLEKARKKFKDASEELGKNLNPILLKSTNLTTWFIKALVALPSAIKNYGNYLIALTGILLAYHAAKIQAIASSVKLRVAMYANIAAAKLKATWITSLRLATLALTAAKALLTGNIAKATKAWRLFNAAFMLTPLGAILAGITALVLAIRLFDTHNAAAVRTEKEKQRLLSDLTKTNDALADSYKNYSAQMANLSKMSMVERKALQQEIKDKIKLAEAELELQKIQMAGVKDMATRATLWQHMKNYFRHPLSFVKFNEADAKKNAEKAVEAFAEPFKEIEERIQELKKQDIDLDEILNAEKLGDAIAKESISQLEEKINYYTIALKNAALGTEEYIRVQKKLQEAEAALNKLRASTPESDYKESEAALEKWNQKEKNLLKEQRLENKLDREAYEDAIYKQELKFQERKIALLRKFGKDTPEIEAKILDDRIKVIDAVEKELAKGLEGISKELETIDKEISSTLSKDIAAGTQKNFKKAIEGAEEFRKKMQELSRDVERVRSGLSLSPKQQHAKEMKELNRIYKSGLLKHKEYNQAKRKIDKTYNDARLGEMMAGIEVGNAALGAASAFYEMQKQRELRTAGDNEAAKEAIERKYFEKNKNTRIAEARISGALAIMRIWEGTISGNPVVDAAIKAALTVAQIATTEFQVKAMKEQTYGGAGGGTSESGDITKRVITGRESGGYWEVEREQDGKLFQADYKPNDRGFIDKPTVLVGESGTEFVINKEGVENPTIKPVLDIIDIAQRQGTITTLNLPEVVSSRVPGRASGGNFTEPSSIESSGGSRAKTTTMDPEYKALMKEVKALLTDLRNNGVKAPVVLSELERMQELKRRSDKLGNR